MGEFEVDPEVFDDLKITSKANAPECRLVDFQPPGRQCKLQLCLFSLEDTWWCASSQVYTCAGASS